MSRKLRRGFTLVELLIVVAIVALLISILMPVLSRAREHARQIICMNNEREIVLACMLYANNNHGTLPLPTFVAVNVHTTMAGDPNTIAIYESRVGHQTYSLLEYDWTRGTLWPWYGSKDIGVRRAMFNCPDHLGKRTTNFSYTFNGEMFSGKGGTAAWLDPNGMNNDRPPCGVNIGTIREPEHKILVVEEEQPLDEYCDFYGPMVLSNLDARQILTSRHMGYANLGMADGHVERLLPADFPCTTKNITLGQAARSFVYPFHYWCELH